MQSDVRACSNKCARNQFCRRRRSACIANRSTISHGRVVVVCVPINNAPPCSISSRPTTTKVEISRFILFYTTRFRQRRDLRELHANTIHDTDSNETTLIARANAKRVLRRNIIILLDLVNTLCINYTSNAQNRSIIFKSMQCVVKT